MQFKVIVDPGMYSAPGNTPSTAVLRDTRKPVYFASSRYFLYLESTVAFLDIDYPSGRRCPHLRICETLT
jgi:hypothetical protein